MYQFSFEKLEVWIEAKDLTKQIYNLTNKFPENEKFGMTNQLRRASVSIPSNIAEGSSRSSNKEFSRFLDFSLGSAYEVETQLLISSDLKFISSEQLQQILPKLNNIIKMILSYHNSYLHYQKSLMNLATKDLIKNYKSPLKITCKKLRKMLSLLAYFVLGIS